MSTLWWRLADFVSQALDADEREAVRGDLCESGRDGASALLDVLGLVARRQAALWLEWRPWAALFGVVIPLGMLLSLVCRFWSEAAAIDAFVYLHNGTTSCCRSPCARRSSSCLPFWAREQVGDGSVSLSRMQPRSHSWWSLSLRSRFGGSSSPQSWDGGSWTGASMVLDSCNQAGRFDCCRFCCCGPLCTSSRRRAGGSRRGESHEIGSPRHRVCAGISRDVGRREAS